MVTIAQLPPPAFLCQLEEPVVTAPLKIKHKTGPFAANAAFCRLISLQLPSSQLDMAEACGSRTHHSTREGPNHRL
jgi:hypothetical protein